MKDIAYKCIGESLEKAWTKCVGSHLSISRTYCEQGRILRSDVYTHVYHSMCAETEYI